MTLVMNRAPAAVFLLVVFFAAQPAWSQKTSENDSRLKRALKQYPEADLNKDGILTRAEAAAFVRDLRGKPGSDNSDKAIEVPEDELNRDDLEDFEPGNPADGGVKMLFIGHSLVAPVESYLRKRVASKAGLKGYESRMQYSGGKTGAPLRHWNYTGRKQTTRPALMTGKWGCLAMGMYYYWAEVEDISRWIDFALKYNPGMKFYLQDGWPAADGGFANYGRGDSRESRALREAAGESWKAVEKDEHGRDVLRFKAFEKLIAGLDRNMDTKLTALKKKYPGKVFSIRSSHAMLELRRLLEEKKLPVIDRVLASGKKDRGQALYADLLHSGSAVILLECYLYLAAVHKLDPRKLPALGEGAEVELDKVLRELAWKITVKNPWSGVKASDLK